MAKTNPPEVQKALKTLETLAETWDSVPRPNEQIPGFDYDKVGNALKSSLLLKDLHVSQRDFHAENLLMIFEPPDIDLSQPSHSALVIHMHMSQARMALETIFRSGNSQIPSSSLDEYADEIEELKIYMRSLLEAIPSLEAETEALKDQVAAMRSQSADPKSSPTDDITISVLGIGVTVSTIRNQAQRVVSAINNSSQEGAIFSITQGLRRIVSWTKSALGVGQMIGQKATSGFSKALGKVALSAASALKVANVAMVKAMQAAGFKEKKESPSAVPYEKFEFSFSVSARDLSVLEDFFELYSQKSSPRDELLSIFFNQTDSAETSARNIPKIISRSFIANTGDEELSAAELDFAKISETEAKALFDATSLLYRIALGFNPSPRAYSVALSKFGFKVPEHYVNRLAS